MKKNLFAFIVSFFALTHINVYSQAGSLDISFGGTGKVITKVPGKPAGNYYNGVVKALALQTDGKIIIGGTAGNRFLTGRYKTNGKVDTTYAHVGFRFDQIADRESGLPDGRGLAIQNDGKIVLGGSTTNNYYSTFWLLRYLSDGSADFTRRNVDFGYATYGTAITLLSDQTVIEVGYYDFLVAKYKTNGYPDSSFGTNGKVHTQLSGIATSVAAEPNDEIIVAGSSGYSFVPNASADIALVKYKQNGTADSSFGLNGIVITDLKGNEVANAVKILPDGKILAAGTTNTLGADNFFVIKYNVNGTIDSSFATNGVAITNFGSGNSECNAMALYNNKIVLGGNTNANGMEDFALAQYNMDGTLDASFGDNGKTTTDFGKNEYANALVVQNDGKIILAGNTDLYYIAGKPPVTSSLALARYNGSNINVAADTTIDSIAVCSNELPFNYNGKEYNSNGNDTLHLTGVNGNDSVVVLVLKIMSVQFKASLISSDESICPGKFAVLTTRVTKGKSPFEYSVDNGATYQSSNRFKVRAGTYQVLVKDSNNCIATTNTVTVANSASCLMMASTVSGMETSTKNMFKVDVFPNPSTSEFILQLADNFNNKTVQIKVTDMAGKTVYQTSGLSNKKYRFGNDFKNGVYAVQILNGINSQTIKIIKSK